MKNLIHVLIIIVYSSSIIISQQAWQIQNSGTTYNLYSVFFLDTITGFAAGQNGTIIKTTNGGINWNSHASLFSGNLNKIYFFNTLTGIVIGDNGMVYKTVDGGINWISKSSSVNSNLFGITFLNSNTGFICGSSGTIIKTISGGENWSSVSSGVSTDLKSICFSSAQTGWIVGASGKILQSTNTGVSWVVNTDIGSNYLFSSINFINSSTGWVTGTITDNYGNKTGLLYKTIAAGSWWYFQLSGENQSINASYFQNENIGWIVTDSGKIAGTLDGGSNWIGQPVLQHNNLYSLSFPAIKVGWITGTNGLILKSSNRGYYDTLNTSRRDIGVLPIVLNKSQLLNAKYRVMFKAPDTSYNIMRSLNGGVSFDTLYSHLHFTDTGKTFDGLLVRVERIRMNELEYPPGTDTGHCGVVRDPGLTAEENQTIKYGWDYLPVQNRYLEGSKYIFNPALPWQSKSMSMSYPCRNSYTGFRSLSIPEDLRSVKIVFTGYGNGQQAYRYLTTSQVSYDYRDMREVPFKVYEVDLTDSSSTLRQLNCAFLEFDTSQGGHPNGLWDPTADSLGGREILYIFNSNYNPVPSTFYTTKNLLLNQPLIDVMYVWSPKLISTGMNYHTGDEFTIYPYTVTRPEICPGYPLYYEFTTQNPIGIKQISTEVPTKMNLSQNYPNPFNPSTKIKFDIPRLPLTKGVGGMKVKLLIYDLLGRQVTTLINEQLKPGTYEVEWDGKNFASGVYFYKLSIGDIKESRKMMLIK